MEDENGERESIDGRGVGGGAGEVGAVSGDGESDGHLASCDEASKAQVGDTEEREVKRCEYSIGIVFKCEHCDKVAVFSDVHIVQSAMQNMSMKGNCPNCSKPIVLSPNRSMITIPVMLQMNRKQRRASGLTGPNGKVVLR